MFRNPTTDLIVLLVIVLLIFGPKRLPGLGRQLGHGLREFKESITGESKESEEGDRPELTRGSATSLSASEPARTTTAGSPGDSAERNS